MKIVAVIAMILTIVGALNWGLVGIGMFMNTNLNLVNLIVGNWPTLESIVYLLVGLSSILVAWGHLSGKCVMNED